MWRLLIASFIISFVPHISYAQNENLDVVSEPICFKIENTADHMILGSIITDYYTNADGIKTRHRSNFRLNPNQSEDYCTYGPFLPNRQLTLTLRSLFPVFECKTRVDMGKIVLKSDRNASDTGVTMWAECFEADGTKTPKTNK